ncbi:MAG: carbon-nitrogen hydrolase family protein [Flavobacteriaceae bacterium]|nr:carbon-nitrogen hydrolase family protein [Flavobacteriaceae bacterium]
MKKQWQDPTLKIGMAQISPVWLNRELTLQKVVSTIELAAEKKVELLVFGEGLIPGYPFWLNLCGGAQWETDLNKKLFSHYVSNAVSIEKGHLNKISQLSKKYKMAIYLGVIERAIDRGNHSLYCSLVYLNQNGEIKSIHRKLMPTYDERLVWGQGDGYGLRSHSLKGFTLGGLNCWENWMPLVRSSFYAQGVNVHCASWPGSIHNTQDITRFIAREGRTYVISVSSLMNKADFPSDTPYLKEILSKAPDSLANGGSCMANPDGSWLIEPIVDNQGVFTAEVFLSKIFQERQNFDPSGHYSRPDVTKLKVNRKRQSVVFNE